MPDLSANAFWVQMLVWTCCLLQVSTQGTGDMQQTLFDFGPDAQPASNPYDNSGQEIPPDFLSGSQSANRDTGNSSTRGQVADFIPLLGDEGSTNDSDPFTDGHSQTAFVSPGFGVDNPAFPSHPASSSNVSYPVMPWSPSGPFAGEGVVGDANSSSLGISQMGPGVAQMGPPLPFFDFINPFQPAPPADMGPGIDGSQCGLENVYSCKNRCGLVDAPCSCHPQCLIYNTCCRDFEADCPSARAYLSDPERRVLGRKIECPDRHHWPVIASCPPQSDAETEKRCRAEMKMTPENMHRQQVTTMSEIIPVTDMLSGLHFKNVHCARCNGVPRNLTLPWSGMFGCSHPPNKLSDLFEEVVNGTVYGTFCPILWQVPRGFVHTNCMPESVLTTPASCPNQTMYDLCHADNSIGYVTATATWRRKDAHFKNRYCLMCDAMEQSHQACHLTTSEEVQKPNNYDYFMTVEWDHKQRTWTFAEAGLDEGFPSIMSNVNCSASEDGSPSDCQIHSCSAAYFVNDEECSPAPLAPRTYTVLARIPPKNSDGHFVDVPGLLHEIRISLENITSAITGENATVVVENVSLKEGAWELFFKVYTFNGAKYVSTYESTVQLRSAVQAVAAARNVSWISACSLYLHGHFEKNLTCRLYSNVTLQPDSNPSQPTDSVISEIWYPRADYRPDKTDTLLGLRYSSSLSDMQNTWGWRSYVSIVFISLSILGLGLRIALQPVVSFFHTYAHKLQFFQCLALLLAYIIFILGGFPPAGSWMCVATAVGTHWGFLSALMWMNINALQIWRIFRPRNWSRASSLTRVHPGWHLYAWLSPALLVAPPIIMDQLDLFGDFSPRYGQGRCWFNGGPAMLIFFVVPTSLLSAVNLMFTVIITYSVHTQKMSYGASAASVLLEVKACGKLVVLVGVTWLLGIPVVIFPDQPVLGDIFTVANATLGFFIAIATMGNRFFIKSVREQIARGKEQAGKHLRRAPPTKISVLSSKRSATSDTDSAPIKPEQAPGSVTTEHLDQIIGIEEEPN